MNRQETNQRVRATKKAFYMDGAVGRHGTDCGVDVVGTMCDPGLK